MSADRRTLLDQWWRAPLASIVLVLAGLAIIAVEVWRDGAADAGGYTAGLALVGLGITGRLQAWILPGGPEQAPDRKKDEPDAKEG